MNLSFNIRKEVIVSNSRKTKKLKKLIEQKRTEIEEIQFQIRCLIDGMLPTDDVSFAFVLGDKLWECPKSPFGLCLYNHYNDKKHDQCVFCRAPEERK